MCIHQNKGILFRSLISPQFLEKMFSFAICFLPIIWMDSNFSALYVVEIICYFWVCGNGVYLLEMIVFMTQNYCTNVLQEKYNLCLLCFEDRSFRTGNKEKIHLSTSKRQNMANKYMLFTMGKRIKKRFWVLSLTDMPVEKNRWFKE